MQLHPRQLDLRRGEAGLGRAQVPAVRFLHLVARHQALGQLEPGLRRPAFGLVAELLQFGVAGVLEAHAAAG